MVTMKHIESFINNNKIHDKNCNLVELEDLRLLKFIISEAEFIALIKNTNFELKYNDLVNIKDNLLLEKRLKEENDEFRKAEQLANIIYENI